MPFDSFAMTAIKNELCSKLIGARTEKIYMPTPNLIVFNFHTQSGKERLLIALNNYARVHLTSQNFDNPLNAPSFCMHLRKYLSGSKITNISQPPYERILEIEFSTFNELRDVVTFRLIAELMGKYSNCIAVNDKGIITDCIKHIPPDINSARALLPNFPYTYPETTGKISVEDTEEFFSRLKDFNGGSLSGYIMGFLKGIAPSAVTEILTGTDTSSIDDNTAKTIVKRFQNYAKKVFDGDIKPSVLFQDGEPEDYYLYPSANISGEWKAYGGINEAIDECMSKKTGISAFRVRYNELFSILKGALAKAEKKRFNNEEKLRDTKNSDKNKLYGELILSNLYNLKARTDKAEVFDYSTNENIIIPLDIKLSPQDNAQKYFKKYNKQKKTAEAVKGQLEEQNSLIDYLETIIESLRQCQNVDELGEIAQEMRASGLIKDTVKSKKTLPVSSSPREFVIDGFSVLIGRNNIQNDRLVRSSRPEDIWLHTKDIHSSHTVIVTGKKVVPAEVIIQAAELTAHFSKAFMSQKVAVDYTLIKYVKKPPASALGRVIYTNQKTVYVNPKESI